MAATSDPTRAPAHGRTGYHNSQAIHPSPPDYDSVSPPSLSSLPGIEQPPSYRCTVQIGGPACIRYESHSPFQTFETAGWTEVFVVLTGTKLSIHQVSQNVFSKVIATRRASSTAGKQLKSYTLQRAEVGVAPDVKKYELVGPPWVTLLPEAMQRNLKKNEPHLFKPVRQYIIRLRLECDQILLRFRTWDERALWIDKFCASVDIAPALEERTEPRYHTLPRRRRHRRHRSQHGTSHLDLPTPIQEEVRPLHVRHPFTHPVGSSEDHDQDHGPEQDQDDQDQAGDPEADDLDSSAAISGDMTLDQNRAPHELANVPPQAYHSGLIVARAHGAAHQIQLESHSTQTNGSETARSEGGAGKLEPTAQMDASQGARYRRRCMPSLLQSSRRGTDIVIHKGAYFKIDWEGKTLRPWPDTPPCYAVKPDVQFVHTAILSAFPDAAMNTRLPVSKSSTTISDMTNSSLSTTDESSSRAGKLFKDVGEWGRKMRKLPGRLSERDDGQLVA